MPARRPDLPRRRDVLRGLGALTVTATSLWVPAHAVASDLSLSDRIDLLYSNQFNFNRRGEPQITIGVMEGQSQVVLSSPRGMRVLPSGDGGTSIGGGGRWRIRRIKGRGATQRYAVVLQELVAPSPTAVSKAAARWRKRGLDVSDHEVGTVFGVDGHVLDTRRILLTTGDYASEKEAASQARILKGRHRALGKLHPTVTKRSEGRLIATDLDSGAEVRAEGVLWFAPARDDQPLTVHDVESGTTIGPRSREDRVYWGQVYVAIDRHGKLAVVNLVSETELLAGLVPAEIYATAPMEALKAQAVCARGQLVSKIGTRHLDDPFLLCSQQHCQVYAGRVREHPKTTKAVRATSGYVLMRPGKTQLVDTVYSANSGGHTEDNDVVWPSPPDPQLRGRPDPLLAAPYARGIDDRNLARWLGSAPKTHSKPSSAHSESYRWKTALDPAAIAGGPGIPKGLGRVRALEILGRGRSGRATGLRVVADRGAIEILGELKIRRALGGLRSSMFIVEPQRDSYGRFVLVGGGHGHGVGLCQHGAMGMAAAGRPYTAITDHYYRGSTSVKLW